MALHLHPRARGGLLHDLAIARRRRMGRCLLGHSWRRTRRRRRGRCPVGGGSRTAGVGVHQRAGLCRSGACGSRNADEVLQAALPVVLGVRRRAVAEELLCHEESCGRARCRASLSGRIWALRRVRGLSILAMVFAEVVVSVCVDVVVVFARVLHARLVRGALGGAASARTATSVAGGRLSGSSTRRAPAGARSSGIRHCAEVIKDCGRASAPYLARQLSESDSH